jgi:hypothetical protein
MRSDTDETRAALERDFLEALARLPQPTRDMAAERFADLLRLSIEAERLRCANFCRARAKLWRTTQMAQNDSPRHAIEEARARANEAEFLADALEAPPEALHDLDS